jgi:choline kinase
MVDSGNVAMEAILLAAGLGRRLEGTSSAGAKALLEVGGDVLLDRHLDVLFGCGVTRVDLVVGFEAERVRERVAVIARGRDVDFVDNRRYVEGSLYSLFCAKRRYLSGQTMLTMDADVLYDPAIVQRLVDDPRPSSVIVDSAVGRGPSFYKLDPAACKAYARVLETMVVENKSRHDGADAFARLRTKVEVAELDVAGLPWIDLNTPADLARAEREIVPRLNTSSPRL